ncbi:Kae1-associated serine/threonine protein kinase [Candidatus Pacearchaeota archaeon]|nr:Kae1-associated serine/threonine protein kinase [Candidatus Pacearchaeota archaeon]
MANQKLKQIQQGAEAIILLDSEKDKIIKKRIKKSYRISSLDKRIRKRRTKREAKMLKKAAKLIPIPENIEESERKKTITMDFLNGSKLSEKLDNFSLKKQKEIMNEIGKSISRLHNSGLIHGDLTTSNMIFQNGEVFFIDFGLGFHSNRFEDKAVDIHVLKEALEAKHFKNWKVLFNEFEKAYENSKHDSKVLKRLKKVEKRGRYKH